MKRVGCFLALGLVWCSAHGVEVQNLRMWPAPDKTRIVFDVSGPVNYRVFSMANPQRVVIDMFDSRTQQSLSHSLKDGRLLAGIRAAPRNKHDLRVVLDLHRRVSIRKSLLAPNRQYGHRLVIDLIDPDLAAAPVAVKSASQAGADGLRDIVIAIDAGHGGDDPGALGSGGTREKDIVLAIARELAALVNRQRGMRAVLVRDGDYYVRLRERMARAREQRADLFISIHADAFKDSRVNGSSVYVLSKSGASSEAARWLAEKENASDLVGGVTLDDMDDVLRSVLLDLSQTAALEASIDVAGNVLDGLKSLGKVHKQRVQHAGFAVLKSPDIPSLLIETAFISNPKEEARLRARSYQKRMAAAIANGVHSYFADSPPPGTLLASRQHHISKGETLSTIARRYDVSAESLRLANNMPGDRLRAGETLQIP